MNLMELQNYGFLNLEPRIEELPGKIRWWIPLNLDEERIALVSEPGSYYLEISAHQISHIVPSPEKINGVGSGALVLTGRFGYQQLRFVFDPNPPVLLSHVARLDQANHDLPRRPSG